MQHAFSRKNAFPHGMLGPLNGPLCRTHLAPGGPRNAASLHIIASLQGTVCNAIRLFTPNARHVTPSVLHRQPSKYVHVAISALPNLHLYLPGELRAEPIKRVGNWCRPRA